MTRVRMSESGTVELPQAMRDAYGLKPGVEFEVIDGGREITLRLVEPSEPVGTPARKLTPQEFLDSIPKYKGSPIELTEEMIEEAVLSEAARRWERVRRQWDEDKND